MPDPGVAGGPGSEGRLRLPPHRRDVVNPADPPDRPGFCLPVSAEPAGRGEPVRIPAVIGPFDTQHGTGKTMAFYHETDFPKNRAKTAALRANRLPFEPGWKVPGRYLRGGDFWRDWDCVQWYQDLRDG
jgi:hypothetical protein